MIVGPAEAALGTIGLANACILAKGAFCRLKIKSTRESKKVKRTSSPKPQQAALPSNRAFFILMACCALGAIVMVALLIGGEIEGPRVAPDIVQKVK